MTSRLKERQEYTKLRLLQITSSNSQMTPWELSDKVEISNGSAYYLLTSLINKGFFKFANFKKIQNILIY
jgi:hypothetical protein